MVAIKNGETVKVPLEEVAGKLKYVDPKDPSDQRGKNDRHQLRRSISREKICRNRRREQRKQETGV